MKAAGAHTHSISGTAASSGSHSHTVTGDITSSPNYHIFMFILEIHTKTV